MCDNYIYTTNGMYHKGSFLPKLKEHFTHCHYKDDNPVSCRKKLESGNKTKLCNTNSWVKSNCMKSCKCKNSIQMIDNIEQPFQKLNQQLAKLNNDLMDDYSCNIFTPSKVECKKHRINTLCPLTCAQKY